MKLELNDFESLYSIQTNPEQFVLLTKNPLGFMFTDDDQFWYLYTSAYPMENGFDTSEEIDNPSSLKESIEYFMREYPNLEIEVEKINNNAIN